MHGCFKSFLSDVDFFHGQLYGCLVTINSIYGLDMVAKKGLWWSIREMRMRPSPEVKRILKSRSLMN